MSFARTVLLLSYISIASLSAAIITPALPKIETTYHLGHGALEWVISIFLLGYVVGQLVYAPLANRYGRVNALRVGLLINLVGIVVCLFAAHALSYPLLLIGRLITALGAASGLACTFMLINESLESSKAKKAMSYSLVSFTLGIGLAVFIGGWVSEYWHWSDCFWVLLVHGVVMLLGTCFISETLETPQKANVLAMLISLKNHFKSPQLVIFSLVVGFVSAFGYSYSAVAPLYANTALHLSPSEYGSWNLMNMIGMLFSGFLAAYCIKRYSEKRTLMIGLFSALLPLAAFVMLCVSHTQNPVWFFLATAFAYLMGGCLFAVGAYFASNASDDKATASSVMSFINMGSAMLCTIVVGYLPWSSLVSFTVCLMVFWCIICVGLRCLPIGKQRTAP